MSAPLVAPLAPRAARPRAGRAGRSAFGGGIASLLAHAALLVGLAMYFARPANVASPSLATLLEIDEFIEPESDQRRETVDRESLLPSSVLDVADHSAELDALVADSFERSARFAPNQPLPVGIELALASHAHGEWDDGAGTGDGIGGGGAAGGNEAFQAIVRHMRTFGLDLVLVFDSTASMGSELRQVKQRIVAIGNAIKDVAPQTRVSVCTYRDKRASFVCRGLPLTDDLGAIEQFVQPIQADGGGDYPEAVCDGLRWAIATNEFRPEARKVILIFGDAPPHPETLNNCKFLAETFRTKQSGIVSTITCRKHQALPEFFQIAACGGGDALHLSERGDLMQELVVLIFGQEHRSEVRELFRFGEPASTSDRPSIRAVPVAPRPAPAKNTPPAPPPAGSRFDPLTLAP